MEPVTLVAAALSAPFIRGFCRCAEIYVRGLIHISRERENRESHLRLLKEVPAGGVLYCSSTGEILVALPASSAMSKEPPAESCYQADGTTPAAS